MQRQHYRSHLSIERLARILHGDALRDRLNLRLSLSQAYAPLHSRQNIQIMTAAIGPHLLTARQRNPQMDVAGHELEFGWHDADDGVLFIVEQNLPADDIAHASVAH